MKYVIDLRKSGTLRATLVRDSHAEAVDVANEWNGRCADNVAVVSNAEKVWYAVYCGGNLDSVVDDARFDQMKADGLFEKDGWDWALVWDGKFYETLREAVHAFLEG